MLGRTRRSVAHPRSPASLPPGPIRFGTACLTDLPAQVQSQLRGMAGETIEWWADRHSRAPAGLAYAAVLGRRALVVALPVDPDPGSPAYVLISYVLGGPVAVQSVEHRPRPDEPRGPAYPGDIGLTAGHRRLLANLPSEAQHLLQRPFEGTAVERCDSTSSTSGELTADEFMVHLANAGRVSIAWGRRSIPPGHTAASAHWSLQVLTARVTRRETMIVRVR